MSKYTRMGQFRRYERLMKLKAEEDKLDAAIAAGKGPPEDVVKMMREHFDNLRVVIYTCNEKLIAQLKQQMAEAVQRGPQK